MHRSLLGGNPEKRRFNRTLCGSAYGNGWNRAHAAKVLECLAIVASLSAKRFHLFRTEFAIRRQGLRDSQMQQVQSRIEFARIDSERAFEILPRRVSLIQRQQCGAAIVQGIRAARRKRERPSEFHQGVAGPSNSQVDSAFLGWNYWLIRRHSLSPF